MNNPNKKRRGAQRGAAAGVIIGIIAVIIIAVLVYFFVIKKAPEKAKILEILPTDSAMYMEIDFGQADENLRKNIWEEIKKFPKVKEQLEDLKEEEGIDPEKDIFPWVGNKTAFALLSVNQSPQMDDAEFVVVFTVKNLGEAESFVKKVREKKGYSEEDYEGVKIWVPKEEDNPAVAFVKSMLVLGNSSNDIRKCIDVTKEKTEPLIKNKNFQFVISKVETPALITYYAHPKALTKQRGLQAQKALEQFPEMKKFMDAIKGVGFSINFKDENLVGTGFYGFDKNSDSEIVKAMFNAKLNVGTPDTIKLFPKDMSLYMCTDVKFMYDVVLKVVENNSKAGPQIGTFKEQFKEQMGVDFDKDIIGNLSGEVAYGLDFTDVMSQMRGGGGRRQPPPIMVALEIEDKEKFNAAYEKITRKFGGMLHKEEYEGNTILLLPKGIGGITVYKDFFIFGIGNGVKKLNQVIDNQMEEDKSLASTASYKLIKDKLGPKTMSVGMLKLEKVLPLLKMGVTMAMAQKGEAEQAESASKVLNLLEKYNEFWFFSTMQDEGVKFHFYVLKSKDAGEEEKSEETEQK